jgi:hypothetical protein
VFVEIDGQSDWRHLERDLTDDDGEVVAAISSMDDLHTERLTLADEGFLG